MERGAERRGGHLQGDDTGMKLFFAAEFRENTGHTTFEGGEVRGSDDRHSITFERTMTKRVF